MRGWGRELHRLREGNSGERRGRSESILRSDVGVEVLTWVVGRRVYDGYLYPSFEKVEGLSLSTLDAFEERLLGLLEKPLEPLLALKDPASHIYICVHAARDCRCGDIGEALYQAILRFIRRKKVGGWMGTPEQDGVRIARVSHIGGHKFAANALVYKQGGEGEWSVPLFFGC